MEKPTFVVDENSDPEVAQEALRDLKRMVKLGDMARRALRGIERDGHYSGLAPVSVQPDDDARWLSNSPYEVRGNHEGKKACILRFVRFHKRLDISRADLGDMSQLRVQFSDTHRPSSYSKKLNPEIPVYIAGPMAVQTLDGDSGYAIRDDVRLIGNVRINKGHLSWLSDGGTHRIYKEMKYEGAKESLEAFSKSVSKHLVHKDDGDMLACAKTLDLQNNAWQWFLEDGHAERMFRDIHELVRVIEVMDA